MPETTTVRDLQLGDVITISDTDVREPVTITGLTAPAPPHAEGQVRFITTADATTGVGSVSTLCVNVNRTVHRHQRGHVPPEQIETPFFGV